MSPDEIAKLAKTFSTACKDAAKKSKTQTGAAFIALSAVTALMEPTKGLAWPST